MQYSISLPHADGTSWPSAGDISKLAAALYDRGYDVVFTASSRYRTLVTVEQRAVAFGREVVAALESAITEAGGDPAYADFFASSSMRA